MKIYCKLQKPECWRKAECIVCCIRTRFKIGAAKKYMKRPQRADKNVKYRRIQKIAREREWQNPVIFKQLERDEWCCGVPDWEESDKYYVIGCGKTIPRAVDQCYKRIQAIKMTKIRNHYFTEEEFEVLYKAFIEGDLSHFGPYGRELREELIKIKQGKMKNERESDALLEGLEVRKCDALI